MDEILSLFTQHAIPYELVQHPALYHMEEGLSLPTRRRWQKTCFSRSAKAGGTFW